MKLSGKTIGLTACVLSMVGTVFGIQSAAGAAHKSAKKTGAKGNVVHVIEHAVTDTEVPSGGGTDVTGNVLTFHNNVYDTADKKQVGTDLGFCIRISPTEGSWTCEWTTFLAKGQINVAGPFYDNKNSVLAITGGTGAYRKARGEMNLNSLMGGKEYDFIFHLS
jgi:allene oxide cyclase